MTIQVVETSARGRYTPDEVRPDPLHNSERLRALLVCLEAGQVIPWCEMPCDVLYYVIQGRGHLHVGDERADLQVGSLVVVPAGTVRSLGASERLRVLAVQVLEET